MNRLKPERQAAIVAALVEGNSIRSIERMTGTHRDTIMRLMVKVGQSCAQIMDAEMRDLSCDSIQMDEIWCYVGKKQRHVTRDDDPSQVGDFWTWVGIVSDSKLVPAYRIGKRDSANAHAFVCDLASRLKNRIQLSSDALKAYVGAVEAGFGGDVDYGTVVKAFEGEPIGPGRYSPPHVVSIERKAIVGDPDPASISTTYIERQNLTMRMSMRRFTRLTNGFSKKLENLKAAVSLHFCHYNFVRVHRTLRMTPAMAAGITNRLWEIPDLFAAT